MASVDQSADCEAYPCDRLEFFQSPSTSASESGKFHDVMCTIAYTPTVHSSFGHRSKPPVVPWAQSRANQEAGFASASRRARLKRQICHASSLEQSPNKTAGEMGAPGFGCSGKHLCLSIARRLRSGQPDMQRTQAGPSKPSRSRTFGFFLRAG